MCLSMATSSYWSQNSSLLKKRLCPSTTKQQLQAVPHPSPIIALTKPCQKLFGSKKLKLSVDPLCGSSRKWRTRMSHLTEISVEQEDVESLKQELLRAIGPLDRGADATPQQQQLVDEIARKLEVLNKIKEPLKSKLLNGKWELLYTTSKSLLQTQRPKLLRPNGKIYQAINTDALRAQNIETWPFFSQATANLVPLNARRVAVKFDFFRIAGFIPIKNPGSGRGELEITYLDKELRISRGNRGNLFVLKMVDPSYRVPL